MHIPEISIACVGARCANPTRKGQPTGTREMEIMFTERGDPVELRPEPETISSQTDEPVDEIAPHSASCRRLGMRGEPDEETIDSRPA